jgi:putative ABC transport system permease protein
MGAILRRLLALIRRDRLERDLDDELAFHLAMRQEEQHEGGVAPKEAAVAARRRFGSVALIKDRTRDAWVFAWFESVLQDARYAVRMFRRTPGFSAVVILTLALGIGLTTAVFSVFRAVILRPLDYPDRERLVWLTLSGGGLPPGQERVSSLDFLDWQDQTTSFDRLVAYSVYDQTVASPGSATRARIAAVSEQFWDIAGVRPLFGRVPKGGERDVAVLTESFFSRHFSGDPDIVGKVITLDRRPTTIVGVLPRTFYFQLPTPVRAGFRGKDVELYRVIAVPSRQEKFVQLLNVVARLKPAASIESARSEIDTIRGRTARRDPMFDRADVQLLPLHDRLVGDNRIALSVLLVAVMFVFLVACANVASLLLARASVREKEMAVRVAIGAGSARLLRQHLVESLLFIALGCAGGLVIARWTVSTAVAISQGAIPRLSEANIDGQALAATTAASVAAALLLAVMPVVVLRRSRVHQVLKDSAKTTSPSAARLRGRRLIVTIQIAIAVTLLTGAGLLMKSFWKLHAFPPGFEPEQVLMMRVDFSGQPSRDQKRAYTDELLRRVQSLPGVQAASINTHGDRLALLNVEGTPPASSDRPQAPIALNMTSSAFATVMGLRVISGRWFTDTEPSPVVVMNESLATRAFGNSDPIGRRVQIPSTTGVPADVRFAPIVGVVADQKYTKLDETPPEEFYVPYSHVSDLFRITLVVKTTRDPLALAPSIRQTILGLDNSQAPFDVMTLEQALADSITPRRFNLLLLGTVAGTALLLALVGIYGVIAYSVAQRTHEIGIRMALGAQRGEVVRMVVRQGMQITFAGVVVGLAAALMLTRVMASLLYEVEPTDPQTFAAVTAALVTMALAASLAPAVNAALVDPVVALRCE